MPRPSGIISEQRGRLVGDAAPWTGQLDVDAFSDDTVTLEVGDAVLSLRVDGENAPILLEDGRVVARIAA